MDVMRELSDEFKLSVRTIAEVFQALAYQVARVASDRTVRFREKGKQKRPTRAAIVSALILWLEDQPMDVQRHVIASGLDKLNGLLDTDQPQTMTKPLDLPVREMEFDPGTGTLTPKPTKAVPKRKRG